MSNNANKIIDAWSHKVIQAVPMKDYNTLFIVDFDPILMKLFIVKANSLHVIESLDIAVNENMVLAPGLDFSLYFLNQFIFNNHEHYDGIIAVTTKD
jgi:hypothetical protein